MTKIALVSDCHLEFADLIIENKENADVLILSGDIMVAEDLHNHPEMSYGMYSNINLEDLGRRQQIALRFRDFLNRCSLQFPHVIYVAGNHEFYHGKWEASLTYMREECKKFPNVHFLENDTVEINGTFFVGATLWTDMNKGDPITMHSISDRMNDFRIIRHDGLGYTRLRPAHAVSRHVQSLNYIKNVVTTNPNFKYVVVTHHAPTYMSIHEKYKHDYVMNGGYASDLTGFILDNPQIKLWTHGHVHTEFDYMVGSTRVLCNPRGYVGYEIEDGKYFPKYLEV